MSPAETTRVREARRADVLEEIRTRFPVEGQKITVTMAGHGLYSRARRAFGGWYQALEEAGRKPGDRSAGFGGDATAMFKNMDAISSNPLPGLPRHLRERQILGGLLLEQFAKMADVDGNAEVLAMSTENHGQPFQSPEAVDFYLFNAFIWALRRYRITHMKHERGALAEIAITSSDGETVKVDVAYNPGETTGNIDLPDARPVEHVDG